MLFFSVSQLGLSPNVTARICWGISTDRAIAIGLARGLHRHGPPSRTPSTTSTTNAQPGPATGSNRSAVVADVDVEVSDHWAYWKRTWRSLVFIDGCVFLSLFVYLSMTQANATTGFRKLAVFVDFLFSWVSATPWPEFMDSAGLP
jgi:hypothetical protein